MRILLQNRIAVSRYSLSVTAVCAACVLLLMPHAMPAHVLMLAIGTFLMLIMNNSNALIRIYSRMVSCSYIVLNVMLTAVFAGYQPSEPWGCIPGIVHCDIVQLCLIASYLIIFNAYQDKKSQGHAFYAFLLIGIAGLFFVQILLFIPLLWLLMARNMMAFSPKICAASLLGAALPYWFATAYCAATGDMMPLFDHFSGMIRLCTMAELSVAVGEMPINTLASLAFILLLTVTGIVHFVRNSYKDKIRTRMIFEMLISVSIFAIALLLWQPQHTLMLTAILTVGASVLIGHFIALTNTRVTNIAFILITVTAIALTAFNIYGSTH